jgi:G:T-mismatch repair DNA endonuclease (very short patch repair protein)
MNKIICKVCKNEIGRQGMPVHLKIHDIKFKDYLEQYFEDFSDFKKCESCNKICKRNKRFCSKECTTKWRKTLIGENSIRHGKSLSEYSKKKISKTQKKRLSKKENHPMYGKHHSDVSKMKMSEARKESGLSKGENNPMYGKTHTPKTIEKIFSHKQMNRLEKIVADYLDEHNIEYTFQFFINEGDVCKSYDFKLKNSNSIIEINGDYWHGGSGVKNHHKDVERTIENDKLKKELAEKKGYKVYVFWEHDLKKDISILTTIL